MMRTLPRFWFLSILTPLLVLATLAHCDQAADETKVAARGGESVSIAALKRYDQMPAIELGTIHGADENVDQAKIAGDVLDLMRAIFHEMQQASPHGDESGDLAKLLEWVSPGEGLYVDLKAHRTHGAVASDLADPQGYIRTYYLNTERLRERASSQEQLAVRDVLKLTRTVTADVYLQEDGRQCELRLRLDDAPSKSYYLNNPVFIHENGKWFIYRLF